jgi:hypothetical protein
MTVRTIGSGGCGGPDFLPDPVNVGDPATFLIPEFRFNGYIPSGDQNGRFRGINIFHIPTSTTPFLEDHAFGNVGYFQGFFTARAILSGSFCTIHFQIVSKAGIASAYQGNKYYGNKGYRGSHENVVYLGLLLQ